MSDPTAQPSIRGIQIPCNRCGAMLAYAPGTTLLVCDHCGGRTPIGPPAATVAERDFHAMVQELLDRSETIEVQMVACRSCGASFEVMPEVAAGHCPYCGSHFNVTGRTQRVVKPNAVLPFSVTRERVEQALTEWLRSLWFAPNAVRREAQRSRRMEGIYLPHWTYDCFAATSYVGWRGVHYYVTVGSGKHRRTERRTRWSRASGEVERRFDDVLVPASGAGLSVLAVAVGDWPLRELLPYDDRYVAGFLAEAYSTDLPTGFERAKGLMAAKIAGDVRAAIGGDVQRIEAMHTEHSDVTFKLVLLPLWTSAFVYRGKVYRFMVNGRTGRVAGERPWSWVKILLASLAGAAAVAGIVWIVAST